jgi:hypothetical protein
MEPATLEPRPRRALHAIAAEIDALINDDGELCDDAEALLDALGMDLESKLESCVGAVRNFAADAAALKAEADHFAKRAQVAAAAEKRLKTYMLNVLQHLNIQKIDAGKWKLRIQANSVPTTTFEGDPMDLPSAFQRVKVDLNAAVCVDAWKAGDPLPDGVKVEKHNHLRIT